MPTLLLLGGDHAARDAAFERAIALNPGLYEATTTTPATLFARGEYARAVELFEAAHRARPDEFQALTLAVGRPKPSAHRARAGELARARAGRLLARPRWIRRTCARTTSPRACSCAWATKRPAAATSRPRCALRPDDFGTLYNAACFHAVAGEPERALDLLDRAISTGQGFRDWIEHDHDLASLQACRASGDLGAAGRAGRASVMRGMSRRLSYGG